MDTWLAGNVSRTHASFRVRARAPLPGEAAVSIKVRRGSPQDVFTASIRHELMNLIDQ